VTANVTLNVRPNVTPNPLADRADLARSLLDLLAPLGDRYSEGCAGYSLGATGALYSPRVALLEGWSRVLWGIAPLLSGGGSFPDLGRHLEGLRRGADPGDTAFWGEPEDSDQRLVEMAAIALSLLIARESFWDPLSPEEKKNLHAWLATIQTRKLPANNWHFFRILVCSAFRRLGLPVDERAEAESFDLVDGLYRGDGWYVDGADANYDFYNPFGFHFYGLVYARLMGDLRPDRAARYVERARLFAPQFLALFREDGSVVPYGRSLGYRFAVTSFFSACAFAGVEAVPWAVMKGVVLRNLRWWFARPILDASGVLTVGYAYPNLVMAEQYNSPGSPYWALKAYLPLALGDDHPFWTAEEAPLPSPLPAAGPAMRLATPHWIVNRSEEDVQLLCPGRYPPWEAVQAAAKYCKFAYSARFGFSVSHGAWALSQTGCDSMLVLSEGDGYWRERRKTSDQASGPDWTSGRWRPWDDVEIVTTLLALGAWHVRVHRIRSARRLETVEGGFSVPRFLGEGLPETPEILIADAEGPAPAGASVAFSWAASRIEDRLLPAEAPYAAPAAPAAPATPAASARRSAGILTLAPNLNILHPHAVLPVLRGSILPGETILACAVRAGDRGPTLSALPPRLEKSGGGIRVIEADGREHRI